MFEKLVSYVSGVFNRCKGSVAAVAAVLVLGLSGGTSFADGLNPADVVTEMTAAKTGASTILAAVAAIWGIFILVKLVKRAIAKI